MRNRYINTVLYKYTMKYTRQKFKAGREGRTVMAFKPIKASISRIGVYRRI